MHRSPNFDARPSDTPIAMLVVHYTGMESAAAALERLCDPASKVGAHYLIGEDGEVAALIDEEMRAWHAGVSSWRGEGDVNGRSLGVELVNLGHEFGYRPFPEPQMAALEALCLEILARHPIEARNVVGHSDVAPRRKTDPGELFDWPRLAGAGIGLWPFAAEPFAAGEDEVRSLLAAFGYETEDLALTLAAFQRHFRPALIDGVADAETAGILKALFQRIPANRNRRG